MVVIVVWLLWTVSLAGCYVICSAWNMLLHTSCTKHWFALCRLFWTVCKYQSTLVIYGWNVSSISIRTESLQEATVFMLLVWTPAVYSQGKENSHGLYPWMLKTPGLYTNINTKIKRLGGVTTIHCYICLWHLFHFIMSLRIYTCIY